MDKWTCQVAQSAPKEAQQLREEQHGVRRARQQPMLALDKRWEGRGVKERLTCPTWASDLCGLERSVFPKGKWCGARSA